MPPLTDALLSLSLTFRIAVTFAMLAPLGVCLGMFMPLGLRAVSGGGETGRTYVAWGWAVNAFASVVGSALATILSMEFGFDVVLVLAMGAYRLPRWPGWCWLGRSDQGPRRTRRLSADPHPDVARGHGSCRSSRRKDGGAVAAKRSVSRRRLAPLDGDPRVRRRLPSCCTTPVRHG